MKIFHSNNNTAAKRNLIKRKRALYTRVMFMKSVFISFILSFITISLYSNITLMDFYNRSEFSTHTHQSYTEQKENLETLYNISALYANVANLDKLPKDLYPLDENSLTEIIHFNEPQPLEEEQRKAPCTIQMKNFMQTLSEISFPPKSIATREEELSTRLNELYLKGYEKNSELQQKHIELLEEAKERLKSQTMTLLDLQPAHQTEFILHLTLNTIFINRALRLLTLPKQSEQNVVTILQPIDYERYDPCAEYREILLKK
jgi:anion-transporting  ArsA/GET3 family ATPase